MTKKKPIKRIRKSKKLEASGRKCLGWYESIVISAKEAK
jgi:hypothetical protein